MMHPFNCRFFLATFSDKDMPTVAGHKTKVKVLKHTNLNCFSMQPRVGVEKFLKPFLNTETDGKKWPVYAKQHRKKCEFVHLGGGVGGGGGGC
jgi:hypothetical protein